MAGILSKRFRNGRPSALDADDTRPKFERKQRMAPPSRVGNNQCMINQDLPMVMANRKTLERAQWQAVSARDRDADGRFVYGVRSTGIYCRPSCPSRRPTRSLVEFFASPDDAERSGFRPCRRCHPRHPAGDPWIEKIQRACVYLANVEGQPSLTVLARRIGGSPYHLQRNFKRILGVTPREFADAARLKKMKRQLRAGIDVTSAVLDAGYGSSSRFYERAAKRLGMTPSQYKRGAADSQISYTVVASPLGKLLVAATDRGVCAIQLGEREDDLARSLASEYPAATIRKDQGALAKWTKDVLDHLGGRLPRLDLPLDLRATAFQWQVWKALSAIPRGETRSYADVASAIGRPGAVRAVARACAANPVALAIPCHRVVPRAGGVGGYRWGSERKRKLLERERQSG
jgi:AraC family transcriptional regulator of adaptative response/methylated-DNA-[protein]-cysteine methyltransferase